MVSSNINCVLKCEWGFQGISCSSKMIRNVSSVICVFRNKGVHRHSVYTDIICILNEEICPQICPQVSSDYNDISEHGMYNQITMVSSNMEVFLDKWYPQTSRIFGIPKHGMCPQINDIPKHGMCPQMNGIPKHEVCPQTK